jgi:peptidoglycan/xylan/chitin deacetylase (PgdA/CDA1 family)
MKRRRPWLMLLLTCLISLLCTNLYIIFFAEFPEKHPEAYPPSPIEETEQNIQRPAPITPQTIESKTDYSDLEHDSQNTSDIQTGQLPDSNVFVREIPLQLDATMEERLAEFRGKTKLLYQEFPESFLISLDTSEKTIALTFDDGPDASSTLEVVNILNKYQVPGTFFLLGQQMDRYPDTVKAILDGGHIIANHSWSHIRPTDISSEEVMEEVNKAEQRITHYNINSKLYRPPYGLVNRSQMPALIEAGYRVISWSIDSMDWYFENPDQIVTCVVENVHPGAIVLMHSSGGSDNRKATIQALPVIIETLLDEGYRFVSLGDESGKNDFKR